MTDAERLIELTAYIWSGYTGRIELLNRAAKDLERLAAIDEVLREQNCTPDDYVRCDAVRAIELLAARDLLPKAEVAADV